MGEHAASLANDLTLVTCFHPNAASSHSLTHSSGDTKVVSVSLSVGTLFISRDTIFENKHHIISTEGQSQDDFLHASSACVVSDISESQHRIFLYSPNMMSFILLLFFELWRLYVIFMTYFGCLIHTHTDTHTLLLSFFCAFHSEATQRHSEHSAVTLGQKAYMLSYNLTHTCNKEVTPSGMTSALFLEICGTDMILKTTNKWAFVRSCSVYCSLDYLEYFVQQTGNTGITTTG